MKTYPVTKEWQVLRHAMASYKLHRRHILGSRREAWGDSWVHAIVWEERSSRCGCSPNNRKPMGILQRLSRELKCRLGKHKLIDRRESVGMDPATYRDTSHCYQSDYCRGRTYPPTRG